MRGNMHVSDRKPMDAQSTPRFVRQAEPARTAQRAPWTPTATLATRCVA